MDGHGSALLHVRLRKPMATNSVSSSVSVLGTTYWAERRGVIG